MISPIAVTLEHACFLARHLNGCDLRYAITAVLLELKVPVKNTGFMYLEEAIVLCMQNPRRLLTKEIYPAVGHYFQPPATGPQVEIAIRRAIRDAWRNRDDSIWRIFFPVDMDGRARKPSNGEFIAGLCSFLQLWRGCCQNTTENNERL